MTDGGLIAFYTADSHVDLSRTVYRPHRLSVAHGPPAASFTCLCHLTDDEGSSRLSIMVPNKKKKLYLYICIYIYVFIYINDDDIRNRICWSDYHLHSRSIDNIEALLLLLNRVD